MDEGGAAYQLRLNQPSEPDPVAALPVAPLRRPVVMVLGMHRSGTSLCSHILSVLGVDMTDHIAGPGHSTPARDNPRGHWERWEIVGFHDRILDLFNRKYGGALHDLPLPTAWWADPRIVEIRREITSFLKERMGDSCFGFKDPRTMRLLPVWHQVVSELNLAPRIILCLRNPAAVARSLHARDGLDPELGEYRWLVHMIDFFRYAGTRDFCAVQYENWFEQPRVNVEKLRSFLDLQWQQSEADLDLVLSDIIDPSLRHDAPQPTEATQPLVRSLYRLATRAEHDAEARSQIGYMATQFAGFQQLQKPLRRAFESLAENAVLAKTANEKTASTEARLKKALAEIEAPRVSRSEMARAGEEKSALRVSLDKAEAALRAATEKAHMAEARLAAALLEADAQRARLIEIEHERDARIAELEAARKQLTTAQSANANHAETITALQARVAELDAALTTADELAQATEAGLTTALAEVDAQRARVAALDSEQNRRITGLQDENALLRQAATHAEQEDRERTRTMNALRSERDRMSEALSAAREVTQAAMQALAADIARPALSPSEPTGWWRALRRRLGLAGGA